MLAKNMIPDFFSFGKYKSKLIIFKNYIFV